MPSPEYVVKHINVLSVGVVAGTGGTNATWNADLARKYASQGYSLYFPPGEYEFDQEILYDTEVAIKVWGDNSILYQLTNGTRLFRFNSVQNLEVAGLQMRSPYYARQTTSGANKFTEALVMADECSDIRIHDNICQGYACYAIGIVGGDTINVSRNQFKDGNWDSGVANSADIAIEQVQADPTRNATEITITENQCNTMSLVGIMSLYPAHKIICTDNQVISKDINGNPITSYLPNARKSGIELQYNMDVADGNDDADSSQHEMMISGNHVQGNRFSGISFQSSNIQNPNTGGVRGSITENVIRYVGFETATLSPRISGGITCNQYRDLIISDNVIKNVSNPPTTDGTGGAGIHIQNVNQFAKTGGTISSATINGNVITDCETIGIRLFHVADTTVTGNVIRDVARRAIDHIGALTAEYPRPGKVTVNGNRIVSTLPVDDDIVELEGSTSEYIFCNNHVEATGAWTPGVSALSLYDVAYTVEGNRLIGDATNATGINVRTSQNIRHDKILIANNVIRDMAVGIQGNPGSARGPVLMNHTMFENCTENVRTADISQIFPGNWVSVSDGTNNELRAIAYSHQIPTQGQWLVGDLVYNNQYASGAEFGWVCTVAGSGGAAQWAGIGGGLPPAGEMVMTTSGQTQAISTTPAPVDVMDFIDIADRVVLDTVNATITISDPGRWLFYFAMNIESTAAKEEMFVEFERDGVDLDLPFRGYTRDAGESISLVTASLADITEAELAGGPTVIQMLIRSGAGTPTITYYNCNFGAVRTH